MSEAARQIYFVLGEDSGDALGADLHTALKDHAAARDETVEIVGLAGTKLQGLGMSSLFDIDDIAVMGLTAVAARLPIIVERVYRTVNDIVRRRPDIVVLIDSPDFTHAVAKRVQKTYAAGAGHQLCLPERVGLAPRSVRKKMRAYIDHVLTILPFEPRGFETILTVHLAPILATPLQRVSQIAACGFEDPSVPSLIIRCCCSFQALDVAELKRMLASSVWRGC